MSEGSQQKPAAPAPAANKTVLVAALLGGLLGAIFSFALSRWLPAPVKAAPPPVPSEARPLADELVAKLKDGNNDEFLTAFRSGFAELNDEEYAIRVGQPLFAYRAGFAKAYGQSLGFEFQGERSLGPNLVQFLYLEKFPQTGVMWLFICYNGPDGWRGVGFRYLKPETAFETLR